MTNDTIIRLSKSITLFLLLACELGAQQTDTTSLMPIVELEQHDTVPLQADFSMPERYTYDPNLWRREIAVGVAVSDATGYELTYRQMRRDKGIELTALYLPFFLDKKLFFEGTIQNAYLDYKSDTFSIEPYRNIKGAWRTVQNKPLPAVPAIKSIHLAGATLSLPFHFWNQKKQIRLQVAPGIGLYQHQYYSVLDLPIKSTESSQIFSYGQQQYSVRITEFYRTIEERREMKIQTDYLPFLAYNTLVGFQITHRLWFEIGGSATIQLKDYNVPSSPSLTKQLSARLRTGLVYRLNPGQKPVKPKKREVIRI